MANRKDFGPFEWEFRCGWLEYGLDIGDPGSETWILFQVARSEFEAAFQGNAYLLGDGFYKFGCSHPSSAPFPSAEYLLRIAQHLSMQDIDHFIEGERLCQ